MNKDVISIIEKYSQIDLINYQHKCEKCNKNCDGIIDEICSCIYKNSNVNTGTYSNECNIFSQNIEYKFSYICENCYKQLNKDVIFFFRNPLHLESFEQLFYDVVNIEQKKNINNCQLPNVYVMQMNGGGSYKSVFTHYEFQYNNTITTNLFYENNQCLSKYFEQLSENEKKHLEIFKIKEYLKMVL